MTASWILAHLPLDDLPGRPRILLGRDIAQKGDRLTIDPETLASLTASVPDTAVTHAALSALPIASAGGWQTHFDTWKAKGLIS